MKLGVVALMLAALAAPVCAQASATTQFESEGMLVLLRYVGMYNKGDAVGLTKEVYAHGDEAALSRQFADLRADSFGKLDVYGADFCSMDADHGKAVLRFARIYTFGGKMNDDEAKLFDLVKTPTGWRISAESDIAFDTALIC
jgi:hypothetical protein